MSLLSRPMAIAVFLSLALAYFFSTLVRAITATLSPTLSAEFGLHAGSLGLLAGGYFLGFAFTQLPLGTWLDRYGPKRVVLCFLMVAVAGSLAFSAATGFTQLLAARVLMGIGVSACLMAPLTGYRRWFSADQQLRANSWMLMTGSFGTLASTLPVQWLVPLTGWRPMFWMLAGLLLLSMAAIALIVPAWQRQPPSDADVPGWRGLFAGYGTIWRHPYFVKLMPLGFFSYGGMLAMQTLWVGPWLIQVSGRDPVGAATGLFWLNIGMLSAFWAWGLVTPWLARRGVRTDRLIGWGVPLSFLLLASIIVLGPRAGALHWTLYCMSCTFISLSQPAVAMAFPPALAGRALSAFNLVIFAGVFVVQWGVGLAIDGFQAAGLSTLDAFRAAMGVFLACCVASWAWLFAAPPHNPGP
ncbi:MAG: MFS transporter [Burkholderiales bacterium]|nr:MFS transporter [Burkholderiales bacterium]